MTMINRHLLRALLPIAALGLVAGCASGPSGINVTRFHLGGPIAKGTIKIEPVDLARRGDLEFQGYATAVAGELRTVGFAPVGDLMPAEYIGVLSYGQTSQAVAKSSGMSVGFGFGGGSYGRNGGVGVGTGVSVPVGGGTNVVTVSELRLQIRRSSDSTTIWEARANAPAAAGAPGAQAALAHALLRDFPGEPGKTVNYKN